MKFSTRVVALSVLVLLSLAALSLSDYSFTERFFTTQFKDAANTTAVWDTVAGNIRLGELDMEIVGSLGGVGGYGFAIDGNYCFIAAGVSGLQVVDISNPSVPFLAGAYGTPGTAVNVAVSGNELFIADSDSGLVAIRILNPTAPTLIGRGVFPAGRSLDVAVNGDFALIAQESEGLYVIDITDVANPALVGSYDTPGPSRAVVVDGYHAFVTDDAGGVHVIDISDPTLPELLGSASLPGGDALDIEVSGNHLFVAGGAGGLSIVDITNPAVPVVVGGYSTPGGAAAVDVDGTYAYVTVTGYGLCEFDIRDRTAPVLLRTLLNPAVCNGRALRAYGEHAFILDMNSGLQVVRAASAILCDGWPGASIPTFGTSSPDFYGPYAVAGNVLYAINSASYTSLDAWDITDPLNPVLLGTTHLHPYRFSSLFAAGNYLYAVEYDETAHFAVLDISNPSSIFIAKAKLLPYTMANYVTVAGNYAYVMITWTPALLVLDVSGGAPAVVASIVNPSPVPILFFAARKMIVAGNYLYIIGPIGFHSVDISDPTHPFVAGTTYGIEPKILGSDMALSGDFAYVAAGNSIIVVDIADPTNPTYAAVLDTDIVRADHIAVSGDLVFAGVRNAASENILMVIDISDPFQPTLLGAVPDVAVTGDMIVAGDHVFARNDLEIEALPVFSRELMASGTTQSLTLNSIMDSIRKARLSARNSGSISWELSADGGSNWQLFSPDSVWSDFLVSGNDIRWRALLKGAGTDSNTVCDSLWIEWSDQAIRPPTISIQPDSLADSLFAGNTSLHTLTIRNSGELALDWSWLAMPDWLTLEPFLGTVAPEDLLEVSATFDAGDLVGGEYSTDLFISSNDPQAPVLRIPAFLHVTGAPHIAISDTLIDFGNLYIGDESSVSLTVTNEGTDELVVDEVIWSNGDISISPTSFSLPVDESHPLLISFAPSTPGVVVDTVRIMSNDPDNGEVKVRILGASFIPPEVEVSTDLIADSLLSGDSSTKSLTVKNIGGSPLTFLAGVRRRFAAGDMTPLINWLSVSPDTGSIAAGDSLDLILTFNAVGMNGGTYLGEIMLHTNDLDEAHLFIPVDLHVTGFPLITVSDTLLDFKNVYVGYVAKRTLVVENVGTDVLNISDISVDDPVFSVAPTSFDLPAGGMKVLTITCAPVQAGPVTATLTITGNDIIHPTYEIDLHAGALEPPVASLSADSLLFTLYEGETSVDTISLYNIGLSDLNWTCGITSGSATASLSLNRRFDKERATSLRILWHGEHGPGGIGFRSTLIADITNRGGVVTESNAEITPALLLSADVLWLGNRDNSFSSSEMEAICNWRLLGGSVLVEAFDNSCISIYNDLLVSIGSGIYYDLAGGLAGPTPNVLPHETTNDVDAIYVGVNRRLGIYNPSALPVINDLILRTVCGAEIMGEGRLFVIADNMFNDQYINNVDNRLFANQVFTWVGVIKWLTVTPSCGTLAMGEAVDIEAAVDATMLPEGIYWQYIKTISNDPANPVISIPVLLTVQEIVPTTLRNFFAITGDRGIEIIWELSETSSFVRFFVLRARGDGPEFLAVESAGIHGSGLSFHFVDTEYEPGATYRYRVDVLDENGRRVLFETEAVTAPHIVLRLHQNHPNPFKEETTVSFTIPERMNVNLSIYDLQGRLVRTLVHDRLGSGYKEFAWDGKDAKGVPVGSGVYFYRLKAGNKEFAMKMLLLR